MDQLQPKIKLSSLIKKLSKMILKILGIFLCLIILGVLTILIIAYKNRNNTIHEAQDEIEECALRYGVTKDMEGNDDIWIKCTNETNVYYKGE